MADQEFLGELEQMILLAVMRLGNSGYAVSIRKEILERVGRHVSRGGVYITLDRLEQKGYLASYLTDPTPIRGGKAKRCYEITSVGVLALSHSRAALLRLWEGLELRLARA
jgi:DNA-binding PadR family transcriptional regulator